MNTGNCVYVSDPQELYNEGWSNSSGAWRSPHYCEKTTYPGTNAEGELRTDAAPYCPEHGGPEEPPEDLQGPTRPVTQDAKDVEIARLKAQLADKSDSSHGDKNDNPPAAKATSQRETKK